MKPAKLERDAAAASRSPGSAHNNSRRCVTRWASMLRRPSAIRTRFARWARTSCAPHRAITSAAGSASTRCSTPAWCTESRRRPHMPTPPAMTAAVAADSFCTGFERSFFAVGSPFYRELSFFNFISLCTRELCNHAADAALPLGSACHRRPRNRRKVSSSISAVTTSCVPQRDMRCSSTATRG